MDESTSRGVIAHLPSEFDAALRWFEELEIAYSATRFGRYRKLLQRVESARIKAESAPMKFDSPWIKSANFHDVVRELDASATLFEANELAMIHQGLVGRGLDSYLRPRLQKLAWIKSDSRMTWIHQYGVRTMPRVSASGARAVGALGDALHRAM